MFEAFAVHFNLISERSTMQSVNFAHLDGRYKDTPPQLVGMYPLGQEGLLEAPYRRYFETRHLKKIVRFHERMNILELGSGNGRWAVSLAPLVYHSRITSRMRR